MVRGRLVLSFHDKDLANHAIPRAAFAFRAEPKSAMLSRPERAVLSDCIKIGRSRTPPWRRSTGN